MSPQPVTPPAPITVEVGEDAGAANVIGIQAWMTPVDYATPSALDARLSGWLDVARERGWLRTSTVVVLPEYVGTWLVAVDERPAVHAAPTTRKALSKVVMAHLGDWRRARVDGIDDPATAAVFAMKADRIARVYQEVMSGLADRYDVTLVAGSVLLPDPVVRDGRIVPTPGAPLRNVSATFGPDGALLAAPAVKAFPTADERAFVAPGDPAAGTVFDAPAGRIGVLVCADGWFPATWDTLAAQGPALVVVPQFTSGDGAWLAPWKGYSGWPDPPDVDPADHGRLTEGEAWVTYGPTRRALDRGLDLLTVPLRGQLWDLGDDGQVRWVSRGVAGEGPRVDAPVLVNLWLSAATPAP